MKKLLFVIALAALSFNAWAGFGILVNDCQYYAGTQNPTPGDPSFQEYMCLGLHLNSSDVLCLYDDSNGSKWVVDLDPASKQAFTKGNSSYTCTTTGIYDFYIKLKFNADQLYIGEGSGNATPTDICSFTPCIAGNGVEGNPWCCGQNWKADGCELTDGSISYTALPTGEYQFKITDGTWNRSWGGNDVDAVKSTEGYYVDTDGNVCFKIGKAADITITFVDQKITLISSVPFEEMWMGSVPSQCPDVMMQGFYYESHTVNDTIGNGTDIYGDTKWRTLYAQSSEIGAYFDLIWLPPSALASGTGYHPRQLSNQNSAWGTKTELAALIDGLHNQGAKVVADVVLNHVEAMAGWCDFAPLNFGEYGSFQPDNSWICNDDEMNEDWTHYDSLANDCWGKASGIPDDGFGERNGYYAAARDWSHSEEAVREMCRAYEKWLINVVHYDGFRYDKGDGYHNSHMGDYNDASKPYISFMEYWSGNSQITHGIHESGYKTMALDFMTKYKAFDGIANFNYSMCSINNDGDWKWDHRGLIGCGWNDASNSKWSKFAVTFIDSHDWFYRGNGQEFGANGCGDCNGISMTDEYKDRLLQALAYQLSAPGVPCVFYPHWKKYKEYIKPMIDARHLAGVHSESDVTDEEASETGYKATFVGKKGYLILFLGDRTVHEGSLPKGYEWLTDNGYKEIAGGNGYAMWVTVKDPKYKLIPELIVTPNADFTDSVNGFDVSLYTEGGTKGEVRTIYYTTDGSEPTTGSASIKDKGTLNFKKTTVLKCMVECDGVQSRVLTYTYTYHKPPKGITVRFNKPAEWNKVYIYAWRNDTVDGEVVTRNLMGAYPGQRIYQANDGWFTYRFAESLKTVTFCINSGRDCGDLDVRSNDITAEYDVCYGWQEGGATTERLEEVLDCDTELHPAFDLSVSPESGSFRDKEEGMAISLNAVGIEGAMIYYTLDGSDPKGCTSPAMDSISFVVHEKTILRAYAYDPTTKMQTSEYKTEYKYKAPQEGPLEVRFIPQKEDYITEYGDTIKAWEDLYLYAFTRVLKDGVPNDTPYSLDGIHTKWPGMKWTSTKAEGGITWSYWQMKPELKEVYIVINEGEGKRQSQDIFVGENTCYLWNPTCSQAIVNELCNGIPEDGLISLKASQVSSLKFLEDGQLFIHVNNKVFDIFGRCR